MALLRTWAPRFWFRWWSLPWQDRASPRVPHEAPQHHPPHSKTPTKTTSLSYPIILLLKRNRKMSNQMIKEWKMDSMSFNPQPFLVATHVVTDVSPSCLHTVRGNCTGSVRIWDCLIIFRQLYDTFTNDGLIKSRVPRIVLTDTFSLCPDTFAS